MFRDHVQLRGRRIAGDGDPVTAYRRQKVKEAMLHAWTSYEKYAWGYDELQPLTKNGENSFGGLGITIVDSLSTLYIMDLKEQFHRAKDWVANSLDFDKNYNAKVFETVIRSVGGLVSAYDLSGEKVFLDKARDIADRLLPAWNTKKGIPLNSINLATGKAHNWDSNQGSSVLAEIGTSQLEFTALSQRTNNPKYQRKVFTSADPFKKQHLGSTSLVADCCFQAENVIKVLNDNSPANGLLPLLIDPNTGRPSSSDISFGAMGDSYYEYLLKAWIQGNKTQAVKFYRGMWEKSMKGLWGLVRKSSPSGYVYICDKRGDQLTRRMQELACFTPGMLALGSSGYAPSEAEKMMSLAEELGRTCYNFYQTTTTKLAGETYEFVPGKDMVVSEAFNQQRPETVESMFYLWRLTGKNKYREWGWNIFQAFENNCRVDTGYVGVKDVNSGGRDNEMQSFFLAETLKYLYLLFSPPTVIPLDQWVFNTEAHPLKIVPRRS
ncbi:hypothetical protein MLD38_006751 [Melastoma candidum]|uniref:Uncharacterized protein n=1 Tax=Melastoma candidum TaxID=119954 RepID=A0ACB9RP07_9MYRT|nr:hypothetical protein MLD38_006751 [Melastoma candidum]